MVAKAIIFAIGFLCGMIATIVIMVLCLAQKGDDNEK